MSFLFYKTFGKKITNKIMNKENIYILTKKRAVKKVEYHKVNQ